jgi:hypothetical protein
LSRREAQCYPLGLGLSKPLIAGMPEAFISFFPPKAIRDAISAKF